MINCKQFTVVLWHANDLEISHVEASVVTDIIIKLLEHIFRNEAPLIVIRGKVHEYLGMTIDYSVKGKATFTSQHHD